MEYTNEGDRIIYREELAPRLPKRIFDTHVHIWDKDSFPPDMVNPERCYKDYTGGTFTMDQWRDAMHQLLPEQEVWANCFGCPEKDSNRDIVPKVDRVHEFAMVLVSPVDPAELVQERIERSRAVGLKPYLNYAAEALNKPFGEVEINEMLTPEQLRMMDAKKLAITLHIPRPGRFADKLNQRQMVALCENYPNITFIFAHIGRAYFMRNIRESNIEELAKYPNAYFDTAMVNSADVLRYTFDHFPTNRICFATDSPVALLRGKSVEINNQYAYLMGENYSVGTTIIDHEHSVKFTTFFYEQLRGILDAAPSGALEDILFNNAKNLFTRLAAEK